VLAILAQQNKTLVRLARDSDTALAPLAREREHFANFIEVANKTGEATAERSGDQRRALELLPETLQKLRGLMVDLEGLADQGTPLLTDVNASAPDLGRLIKAQGTLADASRESFPSLGDALDVGRPALIQARPLIKDLNRLGTEIGPTAKNLDALTKSLNETGGVERINDFLYYLTLSINGYDSLGHYLRAGLVADNCSEYRATPLGGGCNNGNFYTSAESSSASTAAAAGAAGGQSQSNVAATGTLLQGLLGTGETADQARQRKQSLQQLRRQANTPSRAYGQGEPMLDYLLGGDQ
jgi:phospholipid/cholesterol/gamma-HCH transport system substrate-binding protein